MRGYAANLSLMFTELPFPARFAAAAAAGFDAVECQFPYDWPAEDLAATLQATGLRQVLINAPAGNFAAGERGLAALPGREAEFMAGLSNALHYARVLDCPCVHVMSGLVSQGAGRATLLANLRAAAPLAAAAGVELLLEPINTRDIPGYLLTHTREVVDILEAVGAPNVRLQFDLYHRQVMEGDLSRAIREFAPRAAHVQIAQVPDRGEPGHGEIDFGHVLATLADSGYSGWVGCEYRPRNATVAGLDWLWRIAGQAQFAAATGRAR